MRRTDELAPLSREHHVALEVALRLRRAGPQDAAAVRERFLAFYDAESVAHFREEEEVLLAAFARHVPPSDPDVVRVLVEHVEIHRRAGDLRAAADADPAALHELGELLAAHVRHEERTLFPRIEAALDQDELSAVGALLARD